MKCLYRFLFYAARGEPFQVEFGIPAVGYSGDTSFRSYSGQRTYRFDVGLFEIGKVSDNSSVTFAVPNGVRCFIAWSI